jgi:hypothetical protein
MSERIADHLQTRQESTMSDDHKVQRLEWAFRLLIVAFVALWVVYPPHKATPTASVSIAARIAP